LILRELLIGAKYFGSFEAGHDKGDRLLGELDEGFEFGIFYLCGM
jgi:hypothetical protein